MELDGLGEDVMRRDEIGWNGIELDGMRNKCMTQKRMR